MYRTTPIVQKLLLLNIAIFFIHNILDIDLIDSFGLRCVLSSYFRPYQFFTHLFIHTTSGHLFSNMLSLFTFGPVLEQTMRTKRFVSFYAITGLGAALLYAGIQYVEITKLRTLCSIHCMQPTPQSLVDYLEYFPKYLYSSFSPFITHFFENPDDIAYIAKSKVIARELYTLKADIVTVGASGSVFGIFTAFAMLFPNTDIFLIFMPFPIKAKYMILAYGAYEFYAGIKANPMDNVAHFAHLGGILFAYLFVKLWQKQHYR